MTLYHSQLEKRISNQPLPQGIPVFLNKLRSVEPDYYLSPSPQEAAAYWINRQEVQPNQTRVQEAAGNKVMTVVRTNWAKTPEISNKPVMLPGKESSNRALRSAHVKVTSESIMECANKPLPINALTTGVVAKVPALLAELTLQLNVNSIIELPERAYEIKQIKKQLKITQCVLLHHTNILFIEGFVRKNIKYSTRNYTNAEGFYDDIHHCTADIPFKCTTAVSFNGIEPAPIKNNSSSEFEFLKRQDIPGPGFSSKEELLSGDDSQLNQVSTAFYNELPFCELTSSKIVDFNEFLNQTHAKGVCSQEEEPFSSLEEKMVICLSLKILQYRQVAIPPQGD